MTSEKAMLSRITGPAGTSVDAAGVTTPTAIAVLWLCLLLAGCGPRFARPKDVVTSPYPAPKLWAVMPFANESGVSIVDGTRLADKLVQQLQQVNGIRVVPVNRVIEAANASEIGPIDSVGEALSLMHLMDVDGLIVGTVTAYDPYKPPKIGATVQLYSRRSTAARTGVDTRTLTGAATDVDLPGTARYDQPVATAGGYFDAANGDVLKQLHTYASGRSGYDSPAGWHGYLINMDLYSEFVSHELVRRLFTAEWARLTAGQQTAPVTQSSNKP